MRFIYAISPTQSKAARAYLDWSQEDLAKAADVSRSTVYSFENGFCPHRGMVIQIRKTFEKAGIDFTEGEGVKRRDNEARLYRGPDSCDQFFDELLQTVKERDSEVHCFIKSQDLLLQSCGIRNRENLAQLEQLGDTTNVKCLVAELPSQPLSLPSFQFRTLSGHHSGLFSYYLFGNKIAHVMQDGRVDFSFAVFNMVQSAQIHRAHFNLLWNRASPLQISDSAQERSIQIQI